jgi:hypothetical protein
VIKKLRTGIRRGLPKGFKETMSYGMIGYVVPLSLYPSGYHCKKDTPLPFINLASQKQYVAVYHMGIYASDELMSWFTQEYAALDIGKLDMGKSCIRFRKPECVPYDLIEALASKMTPAGWIELYESATGRGGS